MNPWPDLRPILINILWAIVGAVATRAYMPERQTKDLDILVHADDGEEAIRYLTTAGYPVLDLPYLMAMKGTSARTQDMADVSRMLGLATEDELERVRQVIKQYAPDKASRF